MDGGARSTLTDAEKREVSDLLGLRKGSLGAESDLTAAPRPTEATETLFPARYLSALRYGSRTHM